MRLKSSYLFYLTSFFTGVIFTSFLYNVDAPSPSDRLNIFSGGSDGFHFKLVILIISSPQNSPNRKIIRETWGSDAAKRVPVKVLFVIGEEGIPSDLKFQLFKEQSAHSDLLFLPLEDTYENLTKKLLFTLKIASEEYKFDYVMKCDDDTYVNIPLFMNALEKFNDEYLLWGYFSGKARVKSGGKWRQDGWFLCDRYLPYPLGGGYVIGRAVVEFIVKNHLLLSQYKSEDVSLGVWTAPLNITRFHDIRFATEYTSRGCMNDYLVLHKKSFSEMKQMYYNQKHKGVICDKEFLYFLPYTYNWSTFPSSCCKPIQLDDQQKIKLKTELKKE